MIHEASISNEGLARLVLEYRDNAGRAHRIVQKPADAKNYADLQNAHADIYQELLDRRRETAPSSWGRINTDRRDIIGVRARANGQREFLMHNEGLCDPFYIALEGPDTNA